MNAVDFLVGGNFAAGKTSNVELDDIYQAYLPEGAVLPCDTLPNLSSQRVGNIKRLAKKCSQVFFPLFTRQHWIAGVLRYDKLEDNFSLTIHDSAPSTYVHQDLEQIFHKVWPGLLLRWGWCIQQQRGSEDCGLFMTAMFFSLHTKTPILNGRNLPSRLRPFLASLKHVKIPKGSFMRKMVSLLRGKDVSAPLVGGEVPKQKARKIDGSKPAKKSLACDITKTKTVRRSVSLECKKSLFTSGKNVPKKVFHSSTPSSSPKNFGKQSRTHKKKSRKIEHHDISVLSAKKADRGNTPIVPNESDSTLPARFPTSVQFQIQDILRRVSAVQEAAASKQLCYILVVSALLDVADGGHRSYNVNTLARLALRKGFKNGQQYDVGETLANFHRELDFIMDDPKTGKTTIVPRNDLDPSSPSQVWFVQAEEGKGMPLKLFSHVFRLGARYTGKVVVHKNGMKSGLSGHYEVTTNPEEACFGVYLPSFMTTYDRVKNSPKIVNPAKPDPLHFSQKSLVPRKRASGETDPAQVLKDPVQSRLNAIGLSREGTAASPEQWYIYPEMPSSLQPIAWKAKTLQTRRLHIRWLQEIRSMPRYLLGRDLPQAILELVRLIAVKRQWKWSTYAKALVSIQGALENLPLYTNQKKGIRLTECPEWREAVAGAQLQERQSDPDPPTPIASSQMQKVHRELRAKNPQAALFLKMMWMFAARPGDILSLRARDLTFGTPDAKRNVPTTLTIREGKGAKFRGPYPVASVLEKDDASLLQKMVTQTRPSQRIFTECERLREMVRTAIKKECPTAALPSIRKGAVRHLARQGVPESQLMRMTGHTRTDTLKRYLGYGLQLTMEGAEAQANASQLLPQPSS